MQGAYQIARLDFKFRIWSLDAPIWMYMIVGPWDTQALADLARQLADAQPCRISDNLVVVPQEHLCAAVHASVRMLVARLAVTAKVGEMDRPQ